MAKKKKKRIIIIVGVAILIVGIFAIFFMGNLSQTIFGIPAPAKWIILNENNYTEGDILEILLIESNGGRDEYYLKGKLHIPPNCDSEECPYCCNSNLNDDPNDCSPIVLLNGNVYNDEPLSEGTYNVTLVGWFNRFGKTDDWYDRFECRLEISSKSLNVAPSNNEEPECTSDSDCDINFMCINEKCVENPPKETFWAKLTGFFKRLWDFLTFWN